VVAGAESGIDKLLTSEAHAQRFFRFDPFYRYWRNTSKPGVIAMADVIGRDGKDQTYLDHFMPLTGVGDDMEALSGLTSLRSILYWPDWLTPMPVSPVTLQPRTVKRPWILMALWCGFCPPP